MAKILPFTSLTTLNAIVVDTETTGLDARIARIVQVGAVAITGGKLDRSLIIDQLIDPGVLIPPETTSVHGITQDDVAGMPHFKTFAPELEHGLDNRLLIGHTISYDLAVLKTEYRLAGLPWTPPRALDIRTIARLVAPGLADHGLDRLSEWLGVTNTRRHSALGDAVATAEVFLRFVPLLRERNIRTLAEVEAACRALAEADARMSGGLLAVGALPATTDAALSRLDVFAYRHSVRDVMSSPAVIIPADSTTMDAIDLMMEKSLSSVFVALAPGLNGILTERDALRAIHRLGPSILASPVRDFAKHPLQSISEDDYVYRAIGRMERLGFRHLGVHDRSGRIVGALTPKNLLRSRATAAISIGDGIAAASTPEELAATWSEVPVMALNLLREGIDARTIAGVISAEIRGMTRRAAELAEDEMERAGKGRAPVAYTVLVLGSAGRGESLLAADQDNAVIYENGDAGGPADLWFEQMATHMAATLDQAGILFCKGGVMAKTPDWRHSAEAWHRRVAGWVGRQRPEDLLNADIFFDAVAVTSDSRLGNELMAHARLQAHGKRDFMMMLTEVTRRWRAPIGMFGAFQKVDGRVDLKMGGLFPIVSAARVLALRHGVVGVSTEDRLRLISHAGIATADDIDRILQAHETLLRAVLRQQVDDGQHGIPLSPRVDVDAMSKSERSAIKTAISAVAEIVELVAEGRI